MLKRRVPKNSNDVQEFFGARRKQFINSFSLNMVLPQTIMPSVIAVGSKLLRHQ